MTLLLGYHFAAILWVGALGGWMIRAHAGSRAPSLRLARWALLLFPLALVAAVLLKPVGPAFWFWVLPAPWWWMRWAFAIIATLVVGRGMVELALVFIDWARRLRQSMPGTALMDAPWFQYSELCATMRLRYRPQVRFHQTLRTPLVVGWICPVILWPARLVPPALRSGGGWWEGVPVYRRTPTELRTVMAHELHHIYEGDHLKLRLLTLVGCVVPWEWVVGPQMRHSALMRLRVTRWLLGVVARLGAPFRWGISRERELQEGGADAATVRVEPEGPAIANRIRICGGRRNPSLPREVREGVFSEWREAIFMTACALVLVFAPGLAAWRFALEGKMDMLMALPPGWSLVVEPAYGGGSAGRIPGGPQGPGKIVVDITESVPGHECQLRSVGRLKSGDLPAKGRVELEWELEGPDVEAYPRSAYLALAHIPMVEDAEQRAFTLRAPRGQRESLGGGRYRFRQTVDLATLPMPASWVYLFYYFKVPGRYLFSAPKLRIIGEDGTIHPFPSV